MPKKASSQYLFNFHTVTVLTLTALCYAIIFISLYEQRINTSQKAFEQLYYELKDTLNENKLNLKTVSNKLTNTNNVSHRILVMTPSSFPLIYSHHRDDQKNAVFFSLPYWGKTDEKTNKYYIRDSKQLLGWAALPNGYEVYIQIIHPPLAVNWFNPIYWLPFLVALILFVCNLYLVMRQKKAWAEIITYTHNFPNRLNEPYAPLYNKDLNFSQEFKRLANSLNRINQQLHDTDRHIKILDKRLLRLTDYSPLPIFFINKTGQVSYFNRRFEQSFMTAFHENTTYFVTDFLTAKDKITQRNLTKLGSLRTAQTLNVMSIEGHTDYLLHLRPWIGQQGQIKGFSAVLTNISPLTQELGAVAEKVHSQAEKLIEFDKLWSILGHELRTPLSGMISLIELMDTTSLKGNQTEIHSLLLQTSQNMLAMLNDMLDIAKIDAGKLTPILERSDILALSYQVANLLTSSANAKDIELLILFYPCCPRYIETDSIRLQQILMNLINNAIKFTNAGYVALRVKYLPSNDPKLHHMMEAKSNNTIQHTQTSWVCFDVEDTGIGIDELEKSRLFSDFNQANNLINRQFGGTGLGLAISNRFAQLLGGFIHVESQLGQGSTFSLCLPVTSNLYQTSIYPRDNRLSKIKLIAFCSQSISSEALNLVCSHLGFSCHAYTGLSKAGIRTLLNAQSSSNSFVLLVEDELYKTDSLSELENLKIWTTLPKILLSMKPKNAIPRVRRDQYSLVLNKPLLAAELVKALMSLTKPLTIVKKNILSKSSHLTYTKPAATTQSPTEINLPTSLDSNVHRVSSHTTPSQYVLSKEPSLTYNALGFKPLILIAEDNPLNQKIASALVNELGYISITANNGRDVLHLLNTRSDIDLILMDNRMPIIDGLETTRIIRASHNHIPIIALTANNTEEDRKQCLVSGMDDFLLKPIKRTKLAEILTTYLPY